jgi:outer membrane receptor protein involved in Fe transport
MKKFTNLFALSLLRKIFSTLLILVVTTGISMAQALVASARISGLLLDDSGKPMVYATVSLLNALDSSVAKGAITSETGVYSFGHLKAGVYLIEASAVGYKIARSQQITIIGNSIVTVPEIKMQSNSHILSAVSVTATKPLIERKIDRTVVNVENSPLAAGNSAMDILERAPLVSVDKDGNISLKGKQGVTVMINDKLTYLSNAQLATLLRSTDGNTIKSIEIITNPSAKYDAAGNSGIINITLKKNNQAGTNGSLTSGLARGASWRDNETLQLNHKVGNLNLFSSYSHNDAKSIMDLNISRMVTDDVGNKTFFNQITKLSNNYHNNSYRAGADYGFSSTNTIGFVVNGYFNIEDDNNNTRTHIGKNSGTIDSSLRTVSNFYQTFKNFAANLNDVHKIDTSGQQISIDLDYSAFKNYANAVNKTDFYLSNDSIQHPQNYLGNLTPSEIKIYSSKLDYVKPLSKSEKLEAGFKYSDVKTENDLQESKVESIPVISINHFVYNEQIGAMYLNFSKEYKNTTVQAGVRAEYTNSNAAGDSMKLIKRVTNSYFDFFPSVFINRTINDKNQLGLSYSRRIDRPQYDDLNPFTYHLDPYTYLIGNPYLKPQYTNNYEFNYTYNKKITLTLGYSRTTDVITQLPGSNQVTKETYIFLDNLQTQNVYNINLYSPYKITKWWEGDVNATGLYQEFKSENLEGGNLNRGQVGYQIKVTERLTPISGYKLELTGNYQSALVYGLYYIKPIYSVDAGASHSFAKKKANLKLSVSDIFNIRRNDVTVNYGANNLDIRQKRETRIARLTFTYNFGGTKNTAREHQSSADDLNGRVKGSN